MRKSAFVTICKTRSSVEAERLIGLLHNAGLHPADLSLAAPLATPEQNPLFPVQVPSEEADAARQILPGPFEEAA